MVATGTFSKNPTIPDSLYLQLADSVLADLGSMDAVHPVLGYLKHSEKQVYKHAEGIQTRVKAQHNARKLPADAYYTIMELMFELQPADHDHGEEGGPLRRYAEREMGVDAEWRLGRMKVNVQVSGKGNEYLVQRMGEAMEVRFEEFREEHGLPSLYKAKQRLPGSEMNAAQYLLYQMENMDLNGRKADSRNMTLAVYETHEEHRLGLVWKQAESHRISMELTLGEGPVTGTEMNTLLEKEAFVFRTLHLKHAALRVNAATVSGSALGPNVDRLVEAYREMAAPAE